MQSAHIWQHLRAQNALCATHKGRAWLDKPLMVWHGLHSGSLRQFFLRSHAHVSRLVGACASKGAVDASSKAVSRHNLRGKRNGGGKRKHLRAHTRRVHLCRRGGD